METLKSPTQCFVFVIRDKNYEYFCESKISFVGGKPKAYVLLPTTILKRHPKICRLFMKSFVEVLDGGECVTLNVALQNDQVEIVELILPTGKVPKRMRVLVEAGNVALVNLILGKHFTVTKLNFGPLAICSAVAETNLEVLETLLSHKSDISYRNPRGGTLLHLAVLRNNGVVLSTLLNHGINIDLPRNDGSTALHLAIQTGSVAFVKLLICKGASVNATKNDSSTCLLLAAEKRREQIFVLLMQNGAALPSEVSEYLRLLHIGIQNNCSEIVSKLLSHGSSSIPEAVERHGMYSSLLPIAVEKGRVEVVKQLLKLGVSGNMLIPDGRSILHLAVDNESLEMVEVILKQCCYLTSERKNKKALRESVLRKGVNYVKITKMLLQHGLTVDADDINDGEFFHTAVRRNYLEVIQQLLSCGASPNIKFYDTERYYGNIAPLIVAIRYGYRDMLELLLGSGADVNDGCGWNCMPILEAIREFDASAVKLLIDYGAQMADSEILIAAVQRGNAEIVETLLQHGADPNAKCCYRNSHGDIPMAIAAMQSNLKLTNMLLKYGADINGSNGDRSIPLHVASEFGQLPIVEYLIKNKVDMEKKNEIGASALAVAARRGYFSVVDMLLKAGASYEFMNIHDESTLDCTPLEMPQDILQFFFDHGAADKQFMSVMGYLFKVASATNQSVSNGMLWCSTKNLELRLARHLIKLQAAGLHYDALNPTPKWQTSRKSQENFRKACETEVSYIKAQNIENTKVSYYDILISNLRRLTSYARNENVAKVVDAEEFLVESFPIYARIIFCQLQKGIFQKGLLEGGAKSFHFVFRQLPKLPHLVVDKVLGYLRNQDIMILINAVSPMKV